MSCKRTPDPVQWRTTAPVILISIDTLRADHLPAYGDQNVETPEIDRFFKDAVFFEHCYSHCPQTLPSHTSILTGLLPFEHGVRDNLGFFVKPDQVTAASILKKEGFDTGGFISSYVLREETRISRGFDTYDGHMKREKAEVTIAELQRKGQDTIAAARSWLDGRDDSRRFFLFLHLYEPHAPYTPPEPFASRYAGRLYDGEIAYTDGLVGSFLQTLRDKDLYDRSLIIFTGDHGEGLGDHGESEHGVFIYNDTIHVPLAIKFPKNAFAGRRVQTPVQHIDLLPTILDFYGIKSTLPYQGKSLIGILQGGDVKRAIYSESLYPRYHFGWSELYSLTDATYKYIKAPKEELYDLKTDGSEHQNVAATLSSKAGQYRSQIDRIISSSSIEAPAEMTQEELEKLQALGYIGVASTAIGTPNAALPDPKDKIYLIDEFRKGLHLHRTGDDAGAAAVFRKIIDESPDMGDVLEMLGRCLYRLKRVDEATVVLHRVAELRSTNAQSLMLVARIFWKMGMHDEALHSINQALGVNGSLAKAYELKGQILFSKKTAAAATKAFDQAVQLDPTLPLPYYAKGIIEFQAGHSAEALELFRRAENELKKRESQLILPNLHYSIAYLLALKGDLAGAEKEYRDELAGMAGNAGARIGLAQLLLQEGRRKDAVGLFNELKPMNPEAYAVMSNFLRSIGEKEKADQIAAEGRRMAGRRSGG